MAPERAQPADFSVVCPDDAVFGRVERSRFPSCFDCLHDLL